MLLSVTRAISDIASKRFKGLLLSGAFPEVNYQEGIRENGFKWNSYNMFEYSNTYARFMKVVDKRMQAELGDKLGIFTRKHSAKFLADVQKILDSVVETDVRLSPDRFHSFADSVLESM